MIKKAKPPAMAADPTPAESNFDTVVSLIRAARQHAYRIVNTAVIDLYWAIGQHLHHKIAADGWAKGTVVQLAAYIAQREPGLRGFSAQNLWRMRQFYEAYSEQDAAQDEKLSTLLRELPWSAHLHILSRSKRPEEREFYLRMAAQQRWPVREVARQIDSGLFERAVLNPPQLSTALRETHPQAEQHFKDAYLLEFLALPQPHSEADLHRSLLMNLGRFLTELGRDFCYIGSEYPVQVGGHPFGLRRPAAANTVVCGGVPASIYRRQQLSAALVPRAVPENSAVGAASGGTGRHRAIPGLGERQAGANHHGEAQSNCAAQ